MLSLNKLFLIFLAGALVILASCSNKDDDPEPRNTTDLEVVVVNELGERQSGATVNIYRLYDDYLHNNNSLGAKITNSEGKVVFTNLSAINYYIDVVKGTLDNYSGVYKTPAPITYKETTTITIAIK
ncbi:MAG TPA: hypothetical protein VIK89_08985 [Cytophagaceae bacterium]